MREKMRNTESNHGEATKSMIEGKGTQRRTTTQKKEIKKKQKKKKRIGISIQVQRDKNDTGCLEMISFATRKTIFIHTLGHLQAGH